MGAAQPKCPSYISVKNTSILFILFEYLFNYMLFIYIWLHIFIIFIYCNLVHIHIYYIYFGLLTDMPKIGMLNYSFRISQLSWK